MVYNFSRHLYVPELDKTGDTAVDGTAVNKTEIFLFSNYLLYSLNCMTYTVFL